MPIRTLMAPSTPILLSFCFFYKRLFSIIEFSCVSATKSHVISHLLAVFKHKSNWQKYHKGTDYKSNFNF